MYVSFLKIEKELSRFRELPTVWTNVLCGVLLSGAPFSLIHFFLTASALSFLYSAGAHLDDGSGPENNVENIAPSAAASAAATTHGGIVRTARLFAIGLLLLLTLPYSFALFPALILAGFIIAHKLFRHAHPAGAFFSGASRLMLLITSSVAVSGAADVAIWVVGLIHVFYTVVMIESGRDGDASAMMSAGISLLDGILLAALVSPIWFLAGIGGALLTLRRQNPVKAD